MHNEVKNFYLWKFQGKMYVYVLRVRKKIPGFFLILLNFHDFSLTFPVWKNSMTFPGFPDRHKPWFKDKKKSSFKLGKKYLNTANTPLLINYQKKQNKVN